MMKFINATKDDALTLLAGEGAMCPDLLMDASFTVHLDHRKGYPLNGQEKKKLNTDSSKIAELVAAHQFSPKVLWTPLFLAVQGHNADKNVVTQDNKSAISLEENGERSSGKKNSGSQHSAFCDNRSS